MTVAEVKGLDKLVSQLKARAEKAGGSPSVVVGFTAFYAMFAHENVEMKLAGLPRKGGAGHYWDPQGRAQAKFLEEPFRTMRPELAAFVRGALKRGLPLGKALLLAGLRLQRESMFLVPVETGNLRASAFCRLEGE